MSAPSSAQIGWVEEDTFGVFKAPTKFAPLLSFDHGWSMERLESDAVVAGLDIIGATQRNGGPVEVAPEAGFELSAEGLGSLFKHMFGSVSTTGAGPYTHEFTPGDIDALPGLSMQAGVTRPGAAVVPIGLPGLRVTEWELACSAGEIATLGLSMAGTDIFVGSRSVTDGVTTNTSTAISSATAAWTNADVGKPIAGTGIPTGAYIASVTSSTAAVLSAAATATATGLTFTIGPALATASYVTGSEKPLKFTHGSLTLGISPIPITEITVSGSNALKTDRLFLGSAAAGQAMREGRRTFTCSLGREFAGHELYDYVRTGTTMALTLHFNAGAAVQVKVEGNVMFDAAGPGEIDGKSITEEEVELVFCRSTTTNASAIKATIINASSTP